MADYYKFPIKRPRTIDRLEIYDCIEIIANDLARYGVPDQLAMEIIEKHFIPLNKAADKLKKEYGEICFRNSPPKAFFE